MNMKTYSIDKFYIADAANKHRTINIFKVGMIIDKEKQINIHLIVPLSHCTDLLQYHNLGKDDDDDPKQSPDKNDYPKSKENETPMTIQIVHQIPMKQWNKVMKTLN